MCEVEYVDLSDKTVRYERPWVFYDKVKDFSSMRVSEKYKMKAYHYEEEVRSIIYRKENNAGFGIKVDLKSLIEDAYISPFSSEIEMAKTINQLKKGLMKV